MEESSLLERITRVKAPPDFEQKVLAQLSLRKRQLRARTLRLSLAGAFATLLVLFIGINIFFLPGKGLVKLTGLEGDLSSPLSREQQLAPRDYIPIMEAVDYQGEVRSVSKDPTTIYILEQVSDETSTEILY
jgi:hypothetical protein